MKALAAHWLQKESEWDKRERGGKDLLLQKAFSINENAHNLSVIKLKALTKQMRQGL